MQRSERYRRIEALQRAAHQAGVQTHGLRTGLLGGFAIFFTCLLAWLGVGTVLGPMPAEEAFAKLIVYVGIGFSASFLAAVPLAAGFRALRGAQLRRQAAALLPRDRAAALMPLQNDASDDLRKILDPLLCGLRAPTEVAPADTPSGRGNEAMPLP
jgi:hypothetical protein